MANTIYGKIYKNRKNALIFSKKHNLKCIPYFVPHIKTHDGHMIISEKRFYITFKPEYKPIKHKDI